MIISTPLVGASATSGVNDSGITTPIPAVRAYTALRIPFGGTVVAGDITDVQVQIGDQPLFTNINGDFLDARNQFDKMDAFSVAKQLILPQQAKMLDLAQARATILGVPQVGTNPKTAGGTLSFKIAGTNPTYNPAADFVPGIAAATGLVTRLIRQDITMNGAGDYEITNLPFGQIQTQFLRRLFFKLDTGAITRVQLLNSAQAPLFDRTKAQNDDIIAGFGQRDPAAASSFFDFVLDGTESGFAEMLDTLGLSALTLKPTVTGAPTKLQLWGEYVGALQAAGV